jgi:hypothetical protein
MIMPVGSVVMPFFTTVCKGANLAKRAYNGAAGGALCFVAGAAVEVAHSKFI